MKVRELLPIELWNNFENLNALLPGKDPYLDHLCNCLFNKNISPECW